MLKPTVVDTHAHICAPVFGPDRSEVMAAVAENTRKLYG